MKRIRIYSSLITSERLYSALLKDSVEDVDLFLEEKKVRAIDPTVLVAIVGALSTALGALISGLLRIASSNKHRMIIVQSRSGTRIEIPADISIEKVDKIIERIKAIESEEIEIILE